MIKRISSFFEDASVLVSDYLQIKIVNDLHDVPQGFSGPENIFVKCKDVRKGAVLLLPDTIRIICTNIAVI
jgi:hypothetical protein